VVVDVVVVVGVVFGLRLGDENVVVLGFDMCSVRYC